MKKSLIATIILIGLAFYVLWENRTDSISSERKKVESRVEISKDLNPSGPSSPGVATTDQPLATETTPVSLSVTNEISNVAEVYKCLEDTKPFTDLLRKQSPVSMDDLMSQRPPKVFTDLVNVHYQEGDENLRVQLVNEFGEGAEPSVRRFKVLEDGLPERIDLPEQWNQLGPTEILNLITDKHQVSYLEKQQRGRWDGKASLSFTEINGKISELAIYILSDEGKTRVLGCKPARDNYQCQCVQPQ